MRRPGSELLWQDAGQSLRSERGSVVALLLAFWLAFQIIFFAYGVLGQDRGVGLVEFLQRVVAYITIPRELVIVGFGIALCYLVYLALRRVRGLALWQQLLFAAVATFLSAVGFAASVSLVCEWFGVPWPGLSPRFLAAETLRWVAPMGLWAGISLSVTYNSEVRERERRLALFQAQAQEAQMRALRYQVNPHLLYNTLNSIAALILDGKNELAEAMVMRLSSFFRASLANNPLSDVPLADEIALQQLYLDIETMRFPSLVATFDVPDELAQVRVPSLILQPLVENVLKHGINPGDRTTRLEINACRRPGGLEILVRDNGPGTSAVTGTGVGLKNVEDRLQSRFGDKAWVETESRPGEGYSVRMTMPVEAYA
jgi:two-component system, LytTR family, sensor kinase